MHSCTHICAPLSDHANKYDIDTKNGKILAGRKIQGCTQPNVTTGNQPPLEIKPGTSPIYLSIKNSAEVIVRIDPSEVITSDHVSLFGMSHASTY